MFERMIHWLRGMYYYDGRPPLDLVANDAIPPRESYAVTEIRRLCTLRWGCAPPDSMIKARIRPGVPFYEIAQEFYDQLQERMEIVNR